MKKLGLFDKFLFVLNSLLAFSLLLAYLLPYIPPSSFPLISVLSLAMPFLIIANFIFFLFWLLRFKKQLLVSLIVLLVGFNHLTSVYEISPLNDEEEVEGNVKILSYNVKQFNRYGFDKQKNVPEKISAFLREEDPDIIGMQEYYRDEINVADSFPYKYIKLKEKSSQFGLSIFSKFPIINSGSLEFPTSTNNNGIFADVVVEEQDTLRIINVHLQSFNEKPDMGSIEREKSKRVFLGMGRTFVSQQEQVELVLDLVEKSPYKIIIMGDFNNTAYSYIYRKILSRGFSDAYKKAGDGFGRTFDFDYFPLRIDYILLSEEIEVSSFKTKEVPFSDHFPIMAKIKI